MHVFFYGHVGALFKVHVVLLAFVHFHCSAVEHVQNRAEHRVGHFGHERAGECKHGVAAEYGGDVVPLHMHCGASAPHVGSVHHIVVQQGEVVVHLYAHGCGAGFFDVPPKSLAYSQQQHGAQAFAATVQGVFHRTVKSGGLLRQLISGNNLSDCFGEFVFINHRSMNFLQN